MNQQICRRGLPAELLNELFGSLSLENGLGLLAKMPNGLLARNIQKMVNGIKETLKNNKLNEDDRGPKLIISADGLVEKRSGTENDWNCIRAILPFPLFNLWSIINKPKIVFYFEVQILNKKRSYGGRFIGIVIGFCTNQFPLQGKFLGQEDTNSIGIWRKNGILIDGSWTNFDNLFEYFMNEDFVGIGIIHYPKSRKLFVTCNGEILGKAKLPLKFSDVQLFPAVDLADAGNLITVNFGKEKFQFEEFGKVLE